MTTLPYVQTMSPAPRISRGEPSYSLLRGERRTSLLARNLSAFGPMAEVSELKSGANHEYQ
jgi:hypothetical protein